MRGEQRWEEPYLACQRTQFKTASREKQANIFKGTMLFVFRNIMLQDHNKGCGPIYMLILQYVEAKIF